MKAVINFLKNIWNTTPKPYVIAFIISIIVGLISWDLDLGGLVLILLCGGFVVFIILRLIYLAIKKRYGNKS